MTMETGAMRANVPTLDRPAAVSIGHRFYTRPAALKWRAGNDNTKINKLTWAQFADRIADKASEEAAIAAGKPVPPTMARKPARSTEKPEAEELADWHYWIGARRKADNDNEPHRAVTRTNDGPCADYIARQANPGTSRNYEGDIFSRLVADGEHDAALVLRSVSALLSPAEMDAANDNYYVEDAENEIGEGFGLDYRMEQEKAGDVIETYTETGKLPRGRFEFRQRSGNPGGKISAEQRRSEKAGLHFDRYLALRGVSDLPAQEYHSDGEAPWWRSHAQKSARATAELTAACDRTDWKKVTWTRFAPMGARVYGSLSIYSEMKGVGTGQTSAPQQSAVHEIFRRHAEQEFREKMPGRSMRIIDAALRRYGYTKIAGDEKLSRNGARKAVKAALREAWAVLTSITEEKKPEEKKMAA
ncbi:MULTISPECIES: hypothetical protein [unclassified Mesorhizobium]|uniref:hypothetical protein n=1 Tax=unclassified Mesorhizobium TaxID=325217 RepID=UPI0033370288